MKSVVFDGLGIPVKDIIYIEGQVIFFIEIMLEIGICAIFKPVISLLESENFNSGTFAFATVFSDLSTIIPCKRDWAVAAREAAFWLAISC